MASTQRIDKSSRVGSTHLADQIGQVPHLLVKSGNHLVSDHLDLQFCFCLGEIIPKASDELDFSLVLKKQWNRKTTPNISKLCNSKVTKTSFFSELSINQLNLDQCGCPKHGVLGNRKLPGDSRSEDVKSHDCIHFQLSQYIR